jgi:hypothetical protein
MVHAVDVHNSVMFVGVCLNDGAQHKKVDGSLAGNC